MRSQHKPSDSDGFVLANARVGPQCSKLVLAKYNFQERHKPLDILQPIASVHPTGQVLEGSFPVER